ncbi:MAG: 30S ribosomal protein S4 [Candidatus Shapirobacteria bacterium]
MRSTLDTKCRLCRTEGTKLFLKGARCLSSKCPIDKKGAVRPGMHGLKRTKKLSDFAIQLRAKQQAKRYYGGLLETQFRNYYDKAKLMKGLVGQNLLSLLERRLDNTVFMAGLALSRSHARSLVSHKQILINGKSLNIPSYSVKINDEISLAPKIIEKIGDTLKISDKDFKSQEWITVNKAKYSAQINSLPAVDASISGININLIIEYYSR